MTDDRQWKASKCPCGQRGCSSWFVPTQGINGAFDEETARRLVALSNVCAGVPTGALKLAASRFRNNPIARLRLLADIVEENAR